MEAAQLKVTIIERLKNPTFLFGVYIFFAIAASVGTYFGGTTHGGYTHYNNFVIFRQSFYHLVRHLDLYANHEPEYFDYFKYSAAFALAMAPFAFLPVLPSLILWNALNALVLFFAVRALPVKDNTAKVFMLWFILQELLTSMQNSQCNGLMVALLIWSFNKFEKGNVFLAALFILLSAYIKVYGVLAVVLFLFYPGKLKFILYSIFWFIVFAFIPMLLVNFDGLVFLYKGWFKIIAEDHATQYGISVLGLLHTWFNADPDKNSLMLGGLILLLLPLLRIKYYTELNFRINFFASLLIWLIIFNYRAESATYIVAIAGIAIWYFNSRKAKLDTFLVIVAFIITSFSTTDLFPSYLYYHFIKPYTLKALPCILIWIKLTADLIASPLPSLRRGSKP